MPLVQKQITECKYCCKSIIADKYECESCYDKRQTIKVAENGMQLVPDDCMFIAISHLFNKMGYGKSEEDAIDDLMWKVV